MKTAVITKPMTQNSATATRLESLTATATTLFAGLVRIHEWASEGSLSRERFHHTTRQRVTVL